MRWLAVSEDATAETLRPTCRSCGRWSYAGLIQLKKQIRAVFLGEADSALVHGFAAANPPR